MKNAIYFIVILLGSLQIIGFVFQNKAIKGLGQAWGTSPLPIVFTTVKGIETFANDFFIVYTDTNGKEQNIQITPEMYSRLKGPYNRRNVFGAAIAYGPILPEKLLQPVLNYALCQKTLLYEMHLPEAKSINYAIKIKTKTAGINKEWTLKTFCKD